MSERSRRAPSLAGLVRVALLVVVAVLAFVHRQELISAARRLAGLDAIALLAIPTFAVWNHLASIGWRRLATAICAGCQIPSVWRLSAIRLEAQSLNLLLPGTGEALRSALVGRAIRAPVRSTAAVVADNLASTTAAVLFSLVWLGVGVGLFSAGRSQLLPLAVAVIIIVGLIAALWLVVSRVARSDTALPGSGELVILASQPRGVMARAYLAAVSWHLAEKLLAAVEIYVAMRALGVSAGPLEVLFITAMMTGASVLFFFVPAQLGAADAAIVAAFAAVGLAPGLGLSVALVRRGRQLLVCATGIVALVAFERGR